VFLGAKRLTECGNAITVTYSRSPMGPFFSAATLTATPAPRESQRNKAEEGERVLLAILVVLAPTVILHVLRRETGDRVRNFSVSWHTGFTQSQD
jgi:hypothetical protein